MKQINFQKAAFIKSAVNLPDFPKDNLPEFALAGRSNVGKSSFINRLCQNKKLARISNTPGKTRTINFYDVDRAFRIVDLPGYGFARASHTEREAWKRMIENYLEKRENLFKIIQFIDSRHPPMDSDKLMHDFIESSGFESIIVATKIDKLSRAQLGENLEVIRHELSLPETSKIFAFSAKTGAGLEAVKEWAASVLGGVD
jgi:GTP-binding protein